MRVFGHVWFLFIKTVFCSKNKKNKNTGKTNSSQFFTVLKTIRNSKRTKHIIYLHQYQRKEAVGIIGLESGERRWRERSQLDFPCKHKCLVINCPNQVRPTPRTLKLFNQPLRQQIYALLFGRSESRPRPQHPQEPFERQLLGYIQRRRLALASQPDALEGERQSLIPIKQILNLIIPEGKSGGVEALHHGVECRSDFDVVVAPDGEYPAWLS